jgi:phytoene desaturase
VWTRARVKRILVEQGKVCGVVATRDGQEMEIRSGAVLSNAGPRTTVALAGEDRFDKGHLKNLQTLRTIPVFSLHIVSDRPLLDTPALVFTPELDAVDYVCCPTLTCPELAPPGKHMLVVGGTGKEDFGGFLDHKKILNMAVRELRELLPGLDRHGRMLHAACYSRGWPALGSVQGQGMPRKTSVENLYDVGDGVTPSGTFGHVGCLAAARDVVADVKRRLKPGENG